MIANSSLITLLAMTVVLIAPPALAQTASPIGTASREPEGKLSFTGKTSYFVKNTFSVGAVAGAAIPAAIIMADPPKRYPREWRQGGEAFGRNFGDILVQQSALYTGRFVVGAALGEDPRYYPSVSRNPLTRFGHALAFTVVDRSDGHRPRLAVSNFVGAAASGFVGQAYRPRGFDDTTHAGQRVLIGFGFLAADNTFREFSPELRSLGRKLHLPGVK